MHKTLSCVAAAVLSTVAAQAEIDPAKAVQFPVIVDAAAKTGADGLKSGDVFYEQTLRSAKAVRLKSDLSFVYKTRSRVLGGLGLDSDNTLTLKAGQMLVVARHAGVEIYCTAVSDRTEDSLGRIYEIAVCLKDGNHDGVFDALLNFESYPYRARAPYEIGGIGGDAWQPASVAYEEVAPADIPVMHLTFRYSVFKKSGIYSMLAGLQEAHIYTSLCWPQALLTPTAGAGGECGVMDWFALKDEIPADAGAKGVLSVAAMTVSWQRNPDATVKAEVTTPLPAGPALLSTGSWVVTDTELRQATSIVRIAPNPAP